MNSKPCLEPSEFKAHVQSPCSEPFKARVRSPCSKPALACRTPVHHGSPARTAVFQSAAWRLTEASSSQHDPRRRGRLPCTGPARAISPRTAHTTTTSSIDRVPGTAGRICQYRSHCRSPSGLGPMSVQCACRVCSSRLRKELLCHKWQHAHTNLHPLMRTFSRSRWKAAKIKELQVGYRACPPPNLVNGRRPMVPSGGGQASHVSCGYRGA